MEGHTKDFGTIGWAVKQMLNGDHVRRRTWVNIDWVTYVPAGSVSIPQKFAEGFETGPFLVAKVSGGGLVPWLASQADLLAIDWLIDVMSTQAKGSQAASQSSAA